MHDTTHSASSPSHRIVVISDTHLGRPKAGICHAEGLRPLWQGARQFIINGDVAEVQDPRMQIDAAREVDRLYELTEQDGVELTLLSGNHDAYISELRHLLLCDGRVLLTHGDVLHPAVAPWSKESSHARDVTHRARERMSDADFNDIDVRLEIAQHASFHGYLHKTNAGKVPIWKRCLGLPGMAIRVLYYWACVPGLAAGFAEACAPQAEVVVFGHSHRQGVWKRRGRHVVNTGSFGFPGKPWAVVIEASCLCVYPLKRSAAGYHIGGSPVATIQL